MIGRDRDEGAANNSPTTTLWSDRRAVSSAVAYTLTLSIALVLVSGLLIGGTNLVNDQQERTMRSQMGTIGQHVAGSFETADRLYRSSSTSASTVSVTLDLPSAIMGSSYNIEVENDVDAAGNDRITLRPSMEDVQDMSMKMQVSTAVRERSVSGGQVRIFYDSTGPYLVIENV